MESIENLDSRYLSGVLAPNHPEVPEAFLTRAAWQSQVVNLILRLRKDYRRPAFGLTEAEISVHYHRALDDFIALLRTKLR